MSRPFLGRSIRPIGFHRTGHGNWLRGAGQKLEVQGEAAGDGGESGVEGGQPGTLSHHDRLLDHFANGGTFFLHSGHFADRLKSSSGISTLIFMAVN